MRRRANASPAGDTWADYPFDGDRHGVRALLNATAAHGDERAGFRRVDGDLHRYEVLLDTPARPARAQ